MLLKELERVCWRNSRVKKQNTPFAWTWSCCWKWCGFGRTSGPFKDLARVSISFIAKPFCNQMWKSTNEACTINNNPGVFYKFENWNRKDFAVNNGRMRDERRQYCFSVDALGTFSDHRWFPVVSNGIWCQWFLNFGAGTKLKLLADNVHWNLALEIQEICLKTWKVRSITLKGGLQQKDSLSERVYREEL